MQKTHNEFMRFVFSHSHIKYFSFMLFHQVNYVFTALNFIFIIWAADKTHSFIFM